MGIQIGESALQLSPRAISPISTPDKASVSKTLRSRTSDHTEAQVIETPTGSITRVDGKRDAVSFMLDGSFDINNKNQLSAALAEATRCRSIAIDLARTTYIDASIIGVFANVARKRRDDGFGKLQITNVSVQLCRLFSICELDKAFNLHALPV